MQNHKHISNFATAAFTVTATMLACGTAARSAEQTAATTQVEASVNSDALAEKLANPLANIISLPFQLNYDANAGLDEDGDRLVLNVQPVIPFSLGDDFLLITRTILPIIYQDEVIPDGGDTQFGLGDTYSALYLSPRDSGIAHVTYGFGPQLVIPTATNDSLGSEKWSAGPAFVALYQKSPWTIGGLGYHVWSYAGDDDRPYVSNTLLQPFVSYTLGDGWQVLAQVEALYNWNIEEWSIPVSAGFSKVTQLGRQPISVGLQGRYWVDRADGDPEWGLRLVTTFVFAN